MSREESGFNAEEYIKANIFNEDLDILSVQPRQTDSYVIKTLPKSEGLKNALDAVELEYEETEKNISFKVPRKLAEQILLDVEKLNSTGVETRTQADINKELSELKSNVNILMGLFTKVIGRIDKLENKLNDRE